MPNMTPLPTLFLSHGSPMLALEDKPTSHFLRGLHASLPRPRAILVASAHWETPEPELLGSPAPETFHDFYGFPEALYRLQYPAPGDPALAARAAELLVAAGFSASVHPTWPRDHGAWNPLLLMYPEATIPVIQLSVQPGRDARHHYALGRALTPLTHEGVMILGSGNLTHNLREAFRAMQHASRHDAETPAWVSAFAEWVAARVAAQEIDALLDWQRAAPHARENHPTPEHFLPFFVALGAAGDAATPTRLHDAVDLEVLAMDAYRWQGAA